MAEPVAPAPAGDGGANNAPAPAPTAPQAPGTTPAPAAPPAEQLTDAEKAAKASDDEWDAAANDVFPGIKSTKQEKKDEPAKPETTTETSTAAPANPDDKKPDEGQGAGDDSKTEGGDNQAPTDPAAAARAARAQSREYAQQVEAVKADVRSKMFADVATELKDADGDPITSIQDVMQLTDPRTGQAFTEEAAAAWLLNAQQQLAKQVESTNKEIDRISDLNMDLKDQADAITAKYGEYLKANPEVTKATWEAYLKTVESHDGSKIITKAPTDMMWFYDQVVGPKAEAAKQQASASQAADEQAAKDADAKKAADEAEAKKQAEADKKRKQADRSEVFGGSGTDVDTRSDDDKEWDAAAEDYFGKDRLKK